MYCTQDKLGFFGARWACAVTSLIIIAEHVRRYIINRPDWQVSQDELEQICGRFLLLGNKYVQPPVYMANYKDHKDVFNKDKIDDGWSEEADPEAHFYIRDWGWAFAEILSIMGVRVSAVPTSRYGILVVSVGSGKHFIPLHTELIIANPDPTLDGYPEFERRPCPLPVRPV